MEQNEMKRISIAISAFILLIYRLIYLFIIQLNELLNLN